MTKDIKTIKLILLDIRYFGNLVEAKSLERDLNSALSWNAFRVLIVQFPATDPSMIKIVSLS